MTAAADAPRIAGLTPVRIIIDTEIKAKRNNMISELMTFRIMKAKAKIKYGVKYLCEHECEKSFVPMNIITKAKATKDLGGINFTFNLGGNGIHRNKLQNKALSDIMR